MSDLPEPDPVTADRRRTRKRATLPPDAACALCGTTVMDALQRSDAWLLEEHHVLGRAAAPEVTVPLCRNCHAIQTALQHDHHALPPLGRGARTDSVLERIARALLSLALFVHELAHALTGYAARLLALASHLDAMVPGWRDWDASQ